jgi:hypothetical protein
VEAMHPAPGIFGRAELVTYELSMTSPTPHEAQRPVGA